MDNKGGVWKWIGAALVVIVVGVGLGFFLSAPSKSGETQQVATSSSTADSTATPDTAAPAAAPAPAPSGEFTAKGAPQIEIDEQAPSTGIKSTPAVKPAASAAPKPTVTTPTEAPAPSTTDTASTGTTPDSQSQSQSSTDNQPLTTPAPDSTPTPPQAPTPAQNPPPPPTPAPSTSDDTTGTTPDNTDSQADPGTMFHVIVGTTFASEVNARTFAASLRHRGFMAITASVQGDDGTVYKVQVGAYHNRVAAEQAATQLQQSGYPAYIATDR